MNKNAEKKTIKFAKMNNLVNIKKMKNFVLKKNEKIIGDNYRKKSGLLGKNLAKISKLRGTLWFNGRF